MIEDELKHARHNLRGKLNALKLCITALDILKGREDQLEFLKMIEDCTETTVAALNEMEAANARAGIATTE
jgi:hypothetical protein